MATHGNAGWRTLPNGLADYRAQSAAAFSALAGEDRSVGVVLDDKYRPDSNIKHRAGRIFRRIVAEAPKGHFLAVDVPLLAEYCVIIEKLERDHDEFLSAPQTITCPRTGAVKVNPVISAYLKLQQRAALLSQMLRLQPLMRRTRANFGDGRLKAASAIEAPSDNKAAAATSQVADVRARLMFGGPRLAAMLGEQEEQDDE